MTLLEKLDQWARIKPHETAFIFLDKDGRESETISFGDLRQNALRIAGSIRAKYKPQERVVLFFSPGLKFIQAFLGCLYAGVIAIPIPPPQSKRQMARVVPIFDNASPSLILTTRELSALSFNLPVLEFEEALEGFPFENSPAETDIALFQYTSGSTSTPKGVVLTHGHLFQQQQIIEKAFGHTEQTKVMGWLPFYHDMGLIGNLLQPLYLGVCCILMAPVTFMQRPLLWLEAISRYKATTSGGPNFAYQLCTAKIDPEALASLDLSSWTLAYNGAERVRMDTMRAFAQKFSVCGFKESSFFPCYGMAETTLFATGRRGAHSTSYATAEVVSCGKPVWGETVLIVDPQTYQLCLPKTYGEIWISGGSVANGYWNLPEETQKTFQAMTAQGQGPFLRTGDLGFLDQGELFILGRLKNMLILRGKNYFPHDLEVAVANAHPALSSSQGAAFSIDGLEEEQLIFVQEIPRHIKDPQTIFQSIKQTLAEEFTLAPDAIVLVTPNSLPRTTSGKIQHFIVRQNFQENSLAELFSWKRGTLSQIEHADVDPMVGKLSQLLGLLPQEISIDTPLNQLGLDSLSGVQFLTWLEEEYGHALDLPYLFSGVCLQDIQRLPPTQKADETNSFASEFPLSPNQENVWVSCQLQKSSAAYNISFGVKLTGTLDLDAFREAIADVIQRHAPLRTSFVSTRQTVATDVPVPLVIGEEELEPLFDLTKAPLFQIVYCPEKNRLLFYFHHLIFDGGSAQIFWQELETAYQCRKNGVRLNLPPLQAQYNAFVKWGQEFAQSELYKTVSHHWKTKLEDVDYPIVKLSPFQPKMQETASVVSHFIEAQAIKSFAAQHQATPAIVLMAAFHAVCHLYSGEPRIYVGFPSANRPRADFRKMIGFFVNTLVCKTELPLNGTFLDLMNQVKECVWADGETGAFPFQDILQLLHPPRSSNTSPLFQTMFVMQNAPTQTTKFTDLAVEYFPCKSSLPLYDLVLEVQQKTGRFELIFEYLPTKMSQAFVEELKQTYGRFLTKALEEPNAPVGSYDLCDRDSLLSRFEAQAKANPEKIAIFSDSGNFTYQQLHQAVCAIGGRLVEAGVKSSEPVGLCMQREPLAIASMLAILQAGGAYVPIDPTYPEARCQAIVDDAHIRFIVATTSDLAYTGCQIIHPVAEGKTVPVKFPDNGSLAYILYTSGSTGKPKGVMVERKSLLNFALAATQFFEISSQDHVLQFSSLSWDTASEEIYPTLISGASLVLRGNGRVESYEALLERTEKYQITYWNLPSSYWHDLVEMLDRKKLAVPASLRLVIVGGERVSKSPVDRWCKQLAPHVKLLNTYGATEATSISAVFDLSNWSDEWEDVPIGYPIANVQLHILNAHLQPVPAAVAGDLYIAGKGLARGYLNLEQLTSERFIWHPITGERMYRTGDVALRTLSGEILLRGRSDRQVKRRGFRIEIEEIEKNLMALEGVETALVVLKDGLIGYIVLDQGVPISASVIKALLRTKLPDYMIPDQIHILSEIPRLHNGKIDLLSLDAYRKIVPEELVQETWTPTELKILELWKEVLGVSSVGKEQSFFDVGGHSLLLIKLHEKLEQTFETKIDISTLFAHYTIASQAQKLYHALSGLVNLESHHKGPSLNDPTTAILRQYGPPHDRSNLSSSEAPQNSPNLTERGISIPKIKSKLDLLKELQKGSIDLNEAYKQLH